MKDWFVEIPYDLFKTAVSYIPTEDQQAYVDAYRRIPSPLEERIIVMEKVMAEAALCIGQCVFNIKKSEAFIHVYRALCNELSVDPFEESTDLGLLLIRDQ